VWVAGESGVVLHWNGARWSTLPAPTSGVLRGITGDGPHIWVVGEGGGAWRWDGTQWSAFSTGISGLLIGVSGGGSAPLIAVGEGGVIAEGRR